MCKVKFLCGYFSLICGYFLHITHTYISTSLLLYSILLFSISLCDYFILILLFTNTTFLHLSLRLLIQHQANYTKIDFDMYIAS